MGTNSDKGMGLVSGLNSQIAGLMGMARMAKRLKDQATAAGATAAAVARLNEKLAEIDAGPENPVVLLPNAAAVNDVYTHAVDSWQHPPDAVNRYLTAPGPGDGNTGYAGTPIPYGGKIVRQYCGSWLRCDQGSGGNESADAPARR